MSLLAQYKRRRSKSINKMNLLNKIKEKIIRKHSSKCTECGNTYDKRTVPDFKNGIGFCSESCFGLYCSKLGRNEFLEFVKAEYNNGRRSEF